MKLAIAGAAITALFTSLMTMILLRDLDTLDALRFWLVGSLAAGAAPSSARRGRSSRPER